MQATANDAAARGFETWVIEDATATWNDEMQNAALDVMRSRGVAITSTTAVCAHGAAIPFAATLASANVVFLSRVSAGAGE